MKGYVRGFDVRTGKRLWIFHTIPMPGEFGIDTWLNDSWSYTGNTGVWGQISVDEDLGLVYLPVELPTGDYFGAHRPGNGSVRRNAGRGRSGNRQASAGIINWSITGSGTWTSLARRCSPTLRQRARDQGRRAAHQAGFLYVFDRATGQPVWPIEEKPVPKGDVPGEWYSPTQPFPTKPPAYDRQGVTLDDLIDFTPELHARSR